MDLDDTNILDIPQKRYHIGSLIEYDVTEEEKKRYYIDCFRYYGEIKSIDYHRGVLVIQSFSMYPDGASLKFERKMTIFDAQNLNKVNDFQLPPNLRQLYKDQESGKLPRSISPDEIVPESQYTQESNAQDVIQDEDAIAIIDRNKSENEDNDNTIRSKQQEVSISFEEALIMEEVASADEVTSPVIEKLPESTDNNIISVYASQQEPEPEPEQEEQPEPEQEPEAEPEQEPEAEPDQEPEAEPDQEPEAEPHQEPEEPGPSNKSSTEQSTVRKRRQLDSTFISPEVAAPPPGVRRSRRAHKPKWHNVRHLYEEDGVTYIGMKIITVDFMTQAQSREWFGSNIPTVKQAKQRGLKYWKKFAADPNKKRLYYDTDSSTDQDERKKKAKGKLVKPIAVEKESSESEEEEESINEPTPDIKSKRKNPSGFSDYEPSPRNFSGESDSSEESSDYTSEDDDRRRSSVKRRSKVSSKRPQPKKRKSQVDTDELGSDSQVMVEKVKRGRARPNASVSFALKNRSSKAKESLEKNSYRGMKKSRKLSIKKRDISDESDRSQSKDKNKAKYSKTDKKSKQSSEESDQSQSKDKKKSKYSKTNKKSKQSSDESDQSQSKDKKKSKYSKTNKTKKSRDSAESESDEFEAFINSQKRDSDKHKSVSSKSKKKKKPCSSQESQSSQSDSHKNKSKQNSNSIILNKDSKSKKKDSKIKVKNNKENEKPSKNKKKLIRTSPSDYGGFEDVDASGFNQAAARKPDTDNYIIARKGSNSQTEEPDVFSRPVLTDVQQNAVTQRKPDSFDTPLTTKKPPSRPTPASQRNSSLYRSLMVSPVRNYDNERKTALKRMLSNLGAYSLLTDEDDCQIYVDDSETADDCQSILCFTPDTTRGPLVVEPEFMLLKLAWGHAHIDVDGGGKIQVNRDDPVTLEHGSTYNIYSGNQGSILTFTCPIMDDTSHIEDH